MPIFISYSHANSDFATKLAKQLLKRNTHIWIDQWELKVGDSLIQRIQEALTGASALLVILSKASVESEWCKKELSAGLIRELDEKRVVVLTVLMEDCNIPLFLREKIYADFRTNFDQGLKAVLDAIANVTSDTMMRVESPSYLTDWAIDSGFLDGHIAFSIMAVEHAKQGNFCVVTQIDVVGNERATEMFSAMSDAGLDWIEQRSLLDMLAAAADQHDIRLRLDGEHQQSNTVMLNDSKLGMKYRVNIRSRRVGQDHGFAVQVNIAGHISMLCEAQRSRSRKPTAEEIKRLAQIHARFSKDAPGPSNYIKV